jgi:hypothetical protein
MDDTGRATHACERKYSPRVFGDSLDDLETAALMAAAELYGADAVAQVYLHRNYTVYDARPSTTGQPPGPPLRYVSTITLCWVV